ncbi:MAG: tartronate semialdehyde reductase [Methanosaeta sp. PtaB.Bin039]|nr:MAG: tartronate semialdehyde reductase [Methanosaeta sp. PtaB.Bin039]HOT06290.1 NAD(P)-dependent oxidoreductase [Methanotrichaceae archaeon]HQF15731.1 NAD(P)-dependent oxidoreductase [Methanotrichaceae archaeon]HQI90596.1 NAD(P)-dependent oxidoreductase [Methanotrichaceae archaeon]
MQIGFIGLGRMGRTMAERLISQGIDLVVWNRSPTKAEGLRADVASSPLDLAARTPVVVLNLFDSSAVRSVLEGENGLLAADLSGKLIVDTTTNHFSEVLDFHRSVASRGGQYLEAPVLGSINQAIFGTLTVLASGDEAAFERAMPLLQRIGKAIFYLKDPGLATRMKLVNNLVLGSFMATIAEALVFGEEIGIERSQVLDILSFGAGNSGVLTSKRDRLMKDDFSPQFSSALIHKDLHYLQDLARSLNRPLFTGSVVKELYALTFCRGVEKEDFSALYRVLKDL